MSASNNSLLDTIEHGDNASDVSTGELHEFTEDRVHADCAGFCAQSSQVAASLGIEQRLKPSEPVHAKRGHDPSTRLVFPAAHRGANESNLASCAADGGSIRDARHHTSAASFAGSRPLASSALPAMNASTRGSISLSDHARNPNRARIFDRASSSKNFNNTTANPSLDGPDRLATHRSSSASSVHDSTSSSMSQRWRIRNSSIRSVGEP